jgi:plastocyanin
MLPWSADHVRSVPRSAPATAFAFVLLSLPVLGTSIGVASPVRGATHAVEIGDGFFSPASLTVSVGDTVTWTNADDSPHTVTGSGFDSDNLDSGGTFSFTFTEAGTVSYACQYHDEMVATITVVAASSGSGQQAPAAATPAPSGGDAPAATAAPPASHGAAHGGAQPDTAVALSEPLAIGAWIAPLLIGLGLLAFAVGVVPQRSAPTAVRRSSAGWRR